MIDPEFKANWLAALRSGKYQQGQQALRQNNKFCCLGVACDLIDHDLWEETKRSAEGWWYYWKDSGDLLPVSARLAIHIDTVEENILVNMNDEGKSFGEIADYIEANL